LPENEQSQQPKAIHRNVRPELKGKTKEFALINADKNKSPGKRFCFSP
jgi:hypothetical protein